MGRAAMKGNNVRTVLIYDEVNASDQHCANSCQHMAHPRLVPRCRTSSRPRYSRHC